MEMTAKLGLTKLADEFLPETHAKAYSYVYDPQAMHVLIYSKKCNPNVFYVDSLDKVKSRHVAVAIQKILSEGFEEEFVLEDNRFSPEITVTFKSVHNIQAIFKKLEMLEANLLGK